MILIASLVLAPVVGWRDGWGWRSVIRFIRAWTLVLLIQTTALWTWTDAVRDRSTGVLDLSYPLIAGIVLAVGLSALYAAARLHEHHGPHHASAGAARKTGP